MRRFVFALAMLLLIGVLTMPAIVSAAGASVQITGADSVKAKKTITVIVTYKANGIGFVNSQIHYDTQNLSYLSGGSSKGDSGLVQLKMYSNDAKSKKIIFKVKFKALEPGNTVLDVETIQTQNINGDKDLGTPKASKEITIKNADKSTTASSTEKSEKEKVAPEVTEPSLSDDEASTKTARSSPVIWIITGMILAGLIGLVVWRLKK